jgi:hypothetical protein
LHAGRRNNGVVTPDQDYIDAPTASKLIPDHPNASTVWRWMRVGVTLHEGDRVFLRHVTIGNKLLTKAAWVSHFLSQMRDARELLA